MNKKNYIKPAARLTTLQHHQHLLTGSNQVTNISTNLGEGNKLNLGSGSSGTARGRQYDCWGEEEEEE